MLLPLPASEIMWWSAAPRTVPVYISPWEIQVTCSLWCINIHILQVQGSNTSQDTGAYGFIHLHVYLCWCSSLPFLQLKGLRNFKSTALVKTIILWFIAVWRMHGRLSWLVTPRFPVKLVGLTATAWWWRQMEICCVCRPSRPAGLKAAAMWAPVTQRSQGPKPLVPGTGGTWRNENSFP